MLRLKTLRQCKYALENVKLLPSIGNELSAFPRGKEASRWDTEVRVIERRKRKKNRNQPLCLLLALWQLAHAAFFFIAVPFARPCLY